MPRDRKSFVAMSMAFSIVPAPVLAYTCASNMILRYWSLARLRTACSDFSISFLVAVSNASSLLSLTRKKASPCASIDALCWFAYLRCIFLFAARSCRILSSSSFWPRSAASWIASCILLLMSANCGPNFFLFLFRYSSRYFSCSTCHWLQSKPSSFSSRRCLPRFRIIESISSSSILANASLTS